MKDEPNQNNNKNHKLLYASIVNNFVIVLVLVNKCLGRAQTWNWFQCFDQVGSLNCCSYYFFHFLDSFHSFFVVFVFSLNYFLLLCFPKVSRLFGVGFTFAFPMFTLNLTWYWKFMHFITVLLHFFMCVLGLWCLRYYFFFVIILHFLDIVQRNFRVAALNYFKNMSEDCL